MYRRSVGRPNPVQPPSLTPVAQPSSPSSVVGGPAELVTEARRRIPERRQRSGRSNRTQALRCTSPCRSPRPCSVVNRSNLKPPEPRRAAEGARHVPSSGGEPTSQTTGSPEELASQPAAAVPISSRQYAVAAPVVPGPTNKYRAELAVFFGGWRSLRAGVSPLAPAPAASTFQASRTCEKKRLEASSWRRSRERARHAGVSASRTIPSPFSQFGGRTLLVFKHRRMTRCRTGRPEAPLAPAPPATSVAGRPASDLPQRSPLDKHTSPSAGPNNDAVPCRECAVIGVSTERQDGQFASSLGRLMLAGPDQRSSQYCSSSVLRPCSCADVGAAPRTRSAVPEPWQNLRAKLPVVGDLNRP